MVERPEPSRLRKSTLVAPAEPARPRRRSVLDAVPPPDAVGPHPIGLSALDPTVPLHRQPRAPKSRLWSPVPRAALLGLVVAASALAGLVAIGLLGRDGGGASDAVATDGRQEVVAGPAVVSSPDAITPATGGPDPLVVGGAETDGEASTDREAATVAPAGDGTTSTASGGESTTTSAGPRSTDRTTSSDPGPETTATTIGSTTTGASTSAGPTSTVVTTGSTTTRPATTARRSATTRSSTTARATVTQATTGSIARSTTTIARSTTTIARSTTTTARSTIATARPTTTAGGSGTVIWQDDFDRFDASTWRREHSTYGDGNNELQCYQPGNVSVSGGRLILQARTETVTCPNGSTRQVSSGMVRSQGVTFSPGQAIEFRVKLNPADPDDQGGLWPAVWASGWAGGGWPVGGELDWLEVMTAEDPTRAMFSMHYAGTDGAHRLQNRGVRGTADFSSTWHTVRFDYGRNGQLRWSLDGAPAFAVDAAATLQGYPAPFDQTIGEIKINLALGGRPGPLAAGAVGSTGATFEVDYIRIIQL